MPYLSLTSSFYSVSAPSKPTISLGLVSPASREGNSDNFRSNVTSRPP